MVTTNVGENEATAGDLVEFTDQKITSVFIKDYAKCISKWNKSTYSSLCKLSVECMYNLESLFIKRWWPHKHLIIICT